MIINGQINAAVPLVVQSHQNLVYSPDQTHQILNPGIGAAGRQGNQGVKGDPGPRGPMGTIGRKSTEVDYMTKNVSNFATLLLAPNPDRAGFDIVNQSDVDLYVGFDEDLKPGNIAQDKGGILLTKLGSFSNGLVVYTGAIYGITETSSTVAQVTEYL